MDKDIVEIFREKNRQILINSLQYDIEKNITSLLETITNIFNLEFDTAIKNIISIYEDAGCLDCQIFITDNLNQIKLDSYNELEDLLNQKKIQLEESLSNLEFELENLQKYYEIVLNTTRVLKEELHKYSISSVQEKACAIFEKQVSEKIDWEHHNLLISRIRDYFMNRLYGKLETKIHIEIMLRDNNLMNKAKEGYMRYQEICAKTEEK
ncbi:MAG: hypothetical protein PUB18_05805 [bacterium]|nr:hypothetical protein [bacterium]